MQKRRTLSIVLLVLLGFDLGAIITMVSYASSMAHCWSLQQSGLLIECGPQVPIWAWAVVGILGLTLIATLLKKRQSSTR